MNIVVLAGGLSTERDVSFVTSTKVTEALRRKGHNVIMLDVFMGYSDAPCDISDVFERSEEVSVKVGQIKEQAPDIEAVKALRVDKSNCFFGPNVIDICRKADFVFIGLHGENGENGKVQATFDLFGIKYSGTDYLSSAIAMDKGLTKRMFEAAGIPTPNGLALNKNNRNNSVTELDMDYPVVVKPCCGGSSVGVSIVNNDQEYVAALNEAFRWEDEVVIEQYVSGREFSIGVVDGKAYPIIEIAPVEGFYDYKNKYKAGSAVETCPALLPDDITEKMQKVAEDVCRVLGLVTYSRMDFLLNEKNEMFCLEANTLPGMTPTSLLPQEAKALGIDYDDLCQMMVEISMKKYQ